MRRNKPLLLLVTLVLLVSLVACASGPTPAPEGAAEATLPPTSAEAPAPEATPAPATAPAPTLAPAQTPTSIPTPTPVPGKAEILSHSTYVQAGRWKEMFSDTVYEGEVLHIVGEVQNSGSVNLHEFEIEAVFLDANGAAIEAGPTHLEDDPGLLRPGEKAPFLLILLDEEAGKKVASYELALAFQATAEEPQALEILQDTAFLTKQGFHHVLGEVRNAGQNNVDFVKVYGIFYDENGTVIDVDFTYTGTNGLDTLAPGQKSPFEVYSDRADIQEHIRSHSLRVEASVTDRAVYQQLQILTHQSRAGVLDEYIVEGTIQNTGQQDVQFVKIVGTFYGPDKKLVAAAFAFTDPIDLKAGETGTFSLSTYAHGASYGITAAEIDNYDLAFACSNY
jgi:hypothetical protein